MTSEIRSLDSTARLRSAYRPVIEALETRTLLSVNFAEGELAITGTEGGDSVTIRSMPGDRLRVGVNRAITFYTKSEVTKISIDALGGDDRIEVIGGGPDGGI